MSFSTGDGSSSVSGRTDVFLSNVAASEVLGYDQATAKWRNIVAASVPDGGTTNQILIKQSNANGDVYWVSKGVLSDDAPLAPSTALTGVATTAARSDHIHPLPSGLGYPLDPTGFSNPLGTAISTTTSIAAGRIRVSPFPVYKALKVGALMPGLLGNTGTKTIEIAIFASDSVSWRPTARVGGVLSATLSGDTYSSPAQPAYAGGLELTPGLYWVAVLALGSSCSLSTLENKPLANSYHTHEGFNVGSSTFYYNSTSHSSMPSSLGGPFLDNQTPFYYGFKPFAE